MAKIIHGKQGQCSTKEELIQAKKESRALRAAKLRQIKFEDTFCSKAVGLIENRVINQLISGSLGYLQESLATR